MTFQSTPVITDGRTLACTSPNSARSGFNPRPSSLTGERQDGVTEDRVIELFQSTPVITDGRTACGRGHAACQPVSIHARHH